jgi:uncharacterized peroxidase-related enzyme
VIRLPKVHSGQGLKHRLMLKLSPLVVGADAPEILRILFYRPDFFGKPMGVLHQQVLRGPSDWTVAERELFAAWVSLKNNCRFCTVAHTAVAARGFSKPVDENVLTEENIAEQSEKVRAMLDFLAKLTVSPESMAEADLEPLRALGISESAIVDAIYVCMLFCTMNRMVDAFGVGLLTPKQVDKVSRMLLEKGYDM